MNLAISTVVILQLVVAAMMVMLLILGVLTVIRVAKASRRQHQRLNLRCQHCGYDRIGRLRTTTCPECGGDLVDYATQFGLDDASRVDAKGNRSEGDRVS